MGSERISTGLFSPFAIKGKALANRFVMPAMQRGWGERTVPGKPMIEYFRNRAEGGVAMVTSGSCAVDHPSSAAPSLAMYIDEHSYPAWATCVDAVQRAGSLMVIQLWHEGAVRREGVGRYPDHPSISPSGLIQSDQPNGRAASAEELDEVVEAFARSARMAELAGADGVEIHGAHGYLIDQFLWSETNLRTDDYGGPELRHRLTFPLRVVEAVRAAVSPDLIVGFKFSQWKEIDYAAQICASPDELSLMLGTLADAGVDYFHASTRYFWKPEWDSDRTISAWCKSFTDVPVIAVGSVGLDIDAMATFVGDREANSTAERSIAELERRFASGDFDLVAVGRSVIGDPQWVRKAEARRFDDIRAFRRADIDMSTWDQEFFESVPDPGSETFTPDETAIGETDRDR